MKLDIIIITALVGGSVLYRWLRSRAASFNISDSSSPTSPIRDTLFGDMPLDRWTGDGQTTPWSLFAAAKRHLDDGHRDQAIASLVKVLAMPDLEPRHYLQAWHFLRPLAHTPTSEEARRVLGV